MNYLSTFTPNRGLHNIALICFMFLENKSSEYSYHHVSLRMGILAVIVKLAEILPALLRSHMFFMRVFKDISHYSKYLFM